MTTIGNDSLSNLIQTLQEPAPQYVLGCIPAIATVGTAPDSGLGYKMLWIFRCLGCPFSGLFYFINISHNDSIAMSTYWLTSDQFMIRNECGISYRPFGHYAMEIEANDQDETVIKLLNECMAEASVLDRLSSLASAYYILVGIIAGLIKAIHIGPCNEEDWPYLPLALAWTVPAI